MDIRAFVEKYTSAAIDNERVALVEELYGVSCQ